MIRSCISSVCKTHAHVANGMGIYTYRSIFFVRMHFLYILYIRSCISRVCKTRAYMINIIGTYRYRSIYLVCMHFLYIIFAHASHALYDTCVYDQSHRGHQHSRDRCSSVSNLALLLAFSRALKASSKRFSRSLIFFW
jgi:hypothetical protein